MSDAAPYLSPQFPHREEVRRAARLDAMIAQMRAAGQQIPPAMVRQAQHALTVFQSLPAHEQAWVSSWFNGDKQAFVEYQHQHVEQLREQDQYQRADTLSRDLTKDLAGRPGGLSLELAAALRNGDKVKVGTKKMLHGVAADNRVKATTGLSRAEYEALLDEGSSQRKMFKYNKPEKYDAWVAQNFPGRDTLDVDRLLRDWDLEAAGLELRRRAEAEKPDSVTIKADPEAQRRLAVIDAVARSNEARDPNSIFAKTSADRLEAIKAEGTRNGEMDTRAAIANAFLTVNGGSLEVEAGTIRDDVDDSNILAIEEESDHD